MVLRIFEMIATIGFVTALESTKFVFGRGSAQTPLGSLQRSPILPSWFKGPTSKGRRREEKGEVKGKGEGRGGKGRGGEGMGGTAPPFRKFLDPPLTGVSPK